MQYTQDEKILIWLSSFEFLSITKTHALLKFFKDPKKIFDAIVKKQKECIEIIGTLHFNEILEKSEQKYIDNFVNNLTKQNIICSTLLSETYPKLLAEIFEPPINLYTKGDISILKSKSIAIVGTRNPSNYGKIITNKFAKGLSQAGLTIVSGLAMGIDKIAHQGALEVNGKTIAVLGSGFNCIYPAMNVNLAKEIAEKGLLVSEYSPNVEPTKFYFPARNRIIAGLSIATLITEAGEKSGALITKEFAVDFNRIVFAVPGNITSVASAGTNKIIKTCQSACVLDYKDVLFELGITVENEKFCNTIQLDLNEQLILSVIEKEETHYEDLQIKTKLEPKKLNSYLTTMTIKGIIKKMPGNFYCKQ